MWTKSINRKHKQRQSLRIFTSPHHMCRLPSTRLSPIIHIIRLNYHLGFRASKEVEAVPKGIILQAINISKAIKPNRRTLLKALFKFLWIRIPKQTLRSHTTSKRQHQRHLQMVGRMPQARIAPWKQVLMELAWTPNITSQCLSLTTAAVTSMT